MTGSFSAGIPSASGSLRWKDYQTFLLRTTSFMLNSLADALALRPRAVLSLDCPQDIHLSGSIVHVFSLA